MADKKFAIVVTAIDRFSTVFQKAIASVLAFNKPLAETQKQLREVDKDKKIKAFTDDMKQMNSVVTESLGAISALVPGIGLLSGIGSLTALAIGAKNFIDFGQQAYNAHNILGLTIKDLQTYEVALKAVGGQQGQATAALGNFNAVLSDVRFNLPSAAGAKNLLAGAGIDPGTRDNARDTIVVLQEVFAHYDRLRALGRNVSAQKFLAEFGAGDLAPLASRGRAERDARLRQAAANVPLTDKQAKAADDAAATFSIMETQALGFTGSVMEAVGGTVDLMKNLATDSKTRAQFMGFVRSDLQAARRASPLARAILAEEHEPGVALAAPAARARVGPLGQFAARPGETPDQWSDRKIAAQHADAIDELRRRNPQIFAPVPSAALPELHRLKVEVSFNNAPHGTTATTTADASVDATTHFAHSLTPNGP